MDRISDKIKILYTIPNFNTAGSGKVVYDLAKGLNKEKFDVEIACGNAKGSFFAEIEKLGLPIHIMPTTVPLRPYLNLLFRIKPFQSFVKQHHFDIVHSWNWSSDWSEVIASRLAGAQFIYTKKAMTWGNIHWKIKSYLTNFILTINDEMKSYFPNKKNQDLIPLGLDTNYYNPDLFPKKEEQGVFKIITVANLVPVKAIEVLIEAIHKLNDSSVYLDILGDDTTEYARELREVIEKFKLEKQISFLGKHIDVRPFLAQSDLYVIPSKKEGLGMALVEAMAMGIPVLGSNISGINFVLKDFPEFLFEVSNVEVLSAEIKKIAQKQPSERNEIGQQLRKYCIDHYSLENMISKHEDLYLKLARK
ncbi:glycosyltransferase family 4 protein [Flavobacterium sp.]|uniref:glycosyltransferase family 4 protein n=1 Tax=Flavobacterium sp. TaxID=239 RepID=UPI00262C355B|nr:glycosyltransferase family 4 protein [Flavobacterium sp.]